MTPLLISDTERDDFKNALRQSGYDEADFEIEKERDVPPPRQDIYPISWWVIVRRKSTNISKKYKAGHGTGWPEKFDADLKSGVFGPAKKPGA